MRARIIPPTSNAIKDVEDTTLTWAYFRDHWDTPPTVIGTTAAGTVYSYALNGVTRYCLIPEPYDAAQDAFFQNWDGQALSGLIVARGGA